MKFYGISHCQAGRSHNRQRIGETIHSRVVRMTVTSILTKLEWMGRSWPCSCSSPCSSPSPSSSSPPPLQSPPCSPADYLFHPKIPTTIEREKMYWNSEQTSNAFSIDVLFSSSFSTMFDSQKLWRMRKDLLRRKKDFSRQSSSTWLSPRGRAAWWKPPPRGVIFQKGHQL